MQEYIPLLILALIWTIFATIQDLRSREVANWLTFSLIFFTLTYRAFYSLSNKSLEFFLYGLAALAIFIVLGYAFYYSKAFAGGDAKLLMGFGIILPYQTLIHLISLPLLLIFTLFLSGAIYSLAYSTLIVAKNKKTFLKEWKKKDKRLTTLSTALALLSLLAGIYNPPLFALTILFSIPLIYSYTKTLEKCLIVLTSPNKLTEGDWLEEDISLKGKTIKLSVHGLSYKDIQLLKKHNKSVLIKNGIPFVPAFLITLIIMALVFLTSKPLLLSSLF